MVLESTSKVHSEESVTKLHGTIASAGHAALEPAQFSAASQGPCDARHTAVEGLKALGQLALLPGQ